MYKEALEALPVIIQKAGVYRTRKGEKVTIYAFDTQSRFNARGSVFPEKGKPRINAWHVSGRVLAVGESPDDVVEYLGEKF